MTHPSVSMTLKPETLKKYMSDVFIETGSFDGRTIQMALDVGFPKVHSVEIDDQFTPILQSRFGNNPKVQLYKGDSLDLLKKMIDDAGDRPITYWLDAHIQEHAHGKEYVPLLKELEIIANATHKSHAPTLLIDDLRLMGNPEAFFAWRNVLLTHVLNRIHEIFVEYKVEEYILEYEDSFAAEKDILVARKR